MSTLTSTTIDYGDPRTVWSIGLQLIYNIIAMLPLYYYMREILGLPAEARYLLQFLPIVVGILLFFMQLQLNYYFWTQEKIIINRDTFQVVLKSSILVISMFYIIFFLIFSYWMGNSNAYESINITNSVGQLMFSLAVTMSVILFIIIMMDSIQRDRLEGRRSIAERARARFRR